MGPPLPGLSDVRRNLEDQLRNIGKGTHQGWLPGFASIPGGIPFFQGKDKGHEDKPQGEASAKVEDRSKREAEAKAAEERRADAEREERHRKDAAAARSKDRGEFSGRDAEHAGRGAAGKDGPGDAKPPAGKGGAAAQAARTIAGIWKEFNEEDGELPGDRGGTTSGGEDSLAVASGRRSGEDEAKAAPEEPVARIVAYSDSDSDEPLPFQVQQAQRRHARRTLDADASGKGDGIDGSGGGTAAAEDGAQRRHWWRWRSRSSSRDNGDSTAAVAAALQVGVRHPRVRRAAMATKRLGVRQAHGLRDGSTLALLLKVLLAALLRRWQPKAASTFELLSLAVPLPDLLSAWMSRSPVSDSFPKALRRAARDASGFAAPLILLRGFRAASQLRTRLRRKPRRPVRRSISESVMMLRDAVEDKGAAADPADPGGAKSGNEPLTGAPEYAVALAAHRAALHETALTELLRVLEAKGTRLPPDRFDDTRAELLRYAATYGLLEASCPEEGAVALESAAQAICDTLAWRQKRRFMAPQHLTAWDHLVNWQGCDEEGCPVLLVHAARICNDCLSDAQAQQAADAVISQVELGVRVRLDNESGPDQIVVQVLAGGASTLQVTRKVNLIKETALQLNKHYPGRLKRLFLVGLPPGLAWVVDTLRPLLHATTASNLRLCAPDDPCLPLAPSALEEEGTPPESPATPGGGSMQNGGTDAESEYASPRSGFSGLPDVPEASPAALTPLPLPLLRTSSSGFASSSATTPGGAPLEGRTDSFGRRRVFIPDSPVTPVTGTRTPRMLRRTYSDRRSSFLSEPSPRLKPSLKRASYSGMATRCEPIEEQGSGLRRSSSFPRSHALLRHLSLGEILAGTAPLDTEQDLARSSGFLPDSALPPGLISQPAAGGSSKGGTEKEGVAVPARPSSRSMCRPM